MNYKSNGHNIIEVFNSHFIAGTNEKYNITNPGSVLERIANTKKCIRQQFPDLTPDKIKYEAPINLNGKDFENIKKNYTEEQIVFNYALYSLLTAAESEIKDNIPLKKVQSNVTSLIEKLSDKEGLEPIPSSIESNKINSYLANNNIFLFIHKANNRGSYITKPGHVKKRIKDRKENL